MPSNQEICVNNSFKKLAPLSIKYVYLSIKLCISNI